MRLFHCVTTGLVVLLTVPAAATTYVATYTGTVGYGFQSTPYFGAGTTLTGLAYSMVYSLNDSAPGATISGTATRSGISGPAVVRMAITINGITRTIDGSLSSQASTINEINASNQPYVGVFDKVSHNSIEQSITSSYYHEYTADTYIASYAQNFVGSADFRAQVNYGGTTGSDSIYNLVQFNDFDFVANRQINYAYLNMNIGSYAFAQTGGVPEPAGWALLVAGFGLLGIALRRRRAIPTVVS